MVNVTRSDKYVIRRHACGAEERLKFGSGFIKHATEYSCRFFDSPIALGVSKVFNVLYRGLPLKAIDGGNPAHCRPLPLPGNRACSEPARICLKQNCHDCQSCHNDNPSLEQNVQPLSA